MKVSIIGGGISGLVSGIYALNDNHSVTIFEKNSYLGGIDTIDYIDTFFIFENNDFFENLNLKDLKVLDSDYLLNYNDLFLYKDLNKLKEELTEKDVNNYKKIEDLIKGINLASEYKINYDAPLDVMSFLNKARSLISNNANARLIRKYKNISIEEYFEGFNEDIKCLFLNILPKYYPVYLLFLTLSLYTKGKLVRLSDKNEIIERLKDRYIKLGGKIVYNACVSKINFNHLKAVSLSCDEKVVSSDLIIASIDPYYFFKDILKGKNNDRRFALRYEDYKTYPIYSYISFNYKIKENKKLYHDFILDVANIKVASNTFDKLYVSINKDTLVINIRLFRDDYSYFKILSKEKIVYDRLIDNLNDIIAKEVNKAIKEKFNFDLHLSLKEVISPIDIEREYKHYLGAFSSFGIIKNGENYISDGRISNTSSLYLASFWNSAPNHLLSKMLAPKDVYFRIKEDIKKELKN